MKARRGGLSRLAKGVLIASAAGAVILVLGGAAYLYSPAVGRPSAKALNYSLGSEVRGQTLFGRCKRRGERLWRCDVGDSQGSGSATYRLRMDSRSCWHAWKLTPDSQEEGPPLKRQANACVKLHDQVRLFTRLLD